MSHKATIFSVPIFARLRLPTPPTPTPAIFNLSLGETCPKDLPNTVLGTIVIPAVPITALFKKSLRENLVIIIVF